jgi:hypothetical protein
MAPVFRRSTTALVVCCGLLLASQALFVSLPTSAASASSCAELRRWAQPFTHTAPTLDQLAGYDRPHRVAIFNAVTPAVRSALWQEQLRRFDQRTDLSFSQHALINEARALTTPAFYNRDQAAQQTFLQFWSRADKAFTSPDQRRPWFTLASESDAPQLRLTISMWDRLANPFVARADNVFCECSTGWGGECSSCHVTGCTQFVGCGPTGGWTCNGSC